MFKNFIRKIKFKLGYVVCPVCNKLVKYKWQQDYVVSPDEPPMFYHYYCPNCYTITGTFPSTLTEKVVKKLGFDSFDDYVNQVLGQHKKLTK